MNKTEHANPPYHNPILDLFIRAEFVNRGNSVSSSSDLPPLKSVSLVGALLKDTKRNYYMPDDMLRQDFGDTIQILEEFAKAGIGIDENTKFYVYNLLPPVQSDVLLASDKEYAETLPETDLMIILYLMRQAGYKPDYYEYDTSRGYKCFSEISGPETTFRLNSVSELNDKKSVWSDTARNLGAQFVAMTHSICDDEVNPRDFADTEYEGIITSEEPIRMDESFHQLGIVARNFSNIAGATNPETLIGKGMRAPRNIEPYIDYEAESKKRMESINARVAKIVEAHEAGDTKTATALKKKFVQDYTP